MTTVLDALRNADYNIQRMRMGTAFLAVGMEQLHNAVALLEKGYDLETDLEELLEQHGNVENVPEKP